MFIASVLSLLDRNNIRYKLCRLSSAHSLEELKHHGSRLGLGLVEAILFDLEGKGLGMAVIPNSLTIDYNNFSNLLAPHLARPLSLSEIKNLTGQGDSAHIPPIGQLFNAEVHLSPLLERNLVIGFFVDSEDTVVSLEFSEFQRLLEHGPGVPVPTKGKYRAYSEPLRKLHDSCILGISLENPAFQTAKLVAITDWIGRHFQKCVVMMGDGLHRITLQMDGNLPEQQALEYSKWLARDYVYSQFGVFNIRESDCNFDFVFCGEIQLSSRYLDYYRQFGDLFVENSLFRASVLAFSDIFIHRKSIREEHRDLHLKMSCQYLLEELAVLSCLAEESPSTFVYPGSLTILDEIADGRHRDLPAGLMEMDYVNLKLKRR